MTRTNKTNWILREAEPEDFEAIRKLYKIVWGHQRPVKYDRWKYLGFVKGASQITIAVVDEDIVGAFMIAPIDLSIIANQNPLKPVWPVTKTFLPRKLFIFF